MSGSGGGGGYEYQARATAYVMAHILCQQQLSWLLEHSESDIPIAVAEETNAPGDDINITLQDREPINFGKRDAQRILKIAGWKLLHEPGLSADELVEALIDELEVKGYTLQDSEKQAEVGVSFWENRRIFERTKVGYQEVLNFIHLTLCEYAAGHYAADLDDEKIHKWLEKVRQDSKWREAILFAAGLGKGEIIVKSLLELDNPEDTNSPDVLLAAKVSVEVNELPLELIEAVFNRLKVRVESSIPSVAFEAADAILDFSSKVPKLIGDFAKSLSQHTQKWTSIAATRLALACGEDYVDFDILRKFLNEIVIEAVPVTPSEYYVGQTKHIVMFPVTKASQKYGKYGWGCQQQVLFEGYKLLLNKQIGLEIIEEITDLISRKTLIRYIKSGLEDLLKDYCWEKIKNRRLIDEPQHKFLWDTWRKLAIPTFKPRNPKQILQDLKQREQSIYAHQEFLEAVLRAIDLSPASLPKKPHSNQLVTLGILLTGMGWRELPAKEWYVFSQRCDLDAVDTVIRGAISAMNIEPQRLAIEVLLALEDTKQFFSHDLDAVKAALQIEENKDNKHERFKWALERLKEIYASDMLHRRIPEVPADPQWERAREVDISPKDLVRALKHPSKVILANATLLLMHGVGGSEAINLIEELLKENKDNEQVHWAVSHIAPHLLKY
jgi:hypothetical protein